MSTKRDKFFAKLNHYLESHHRDEKLKPGYCHGLVLLWLYLMIEKRGDWLYRIIDKIVSCDSDDYESIETDIEKLLSHMEWLQNSCKYNYSVNQLDFEGLTGLHREGSLSFLLQNNDLDKVLKRIFNKDAVVCISGPSHTVGIVKRDKKIVFFDADYVDLHPKVIKKLSSVKVELVKSLFKRTYIPDVKLPLQINVLAKMPTQSNSLDSTYQFLMKKYKDDDDLGFERISNLYLACESGDERMVRDLLEANVDPNKQSREQWAPLHVAATNGYSSIVKLLLQFGAIPNLKNQQGATAADLAEAFQHDDVVRLLGVSSPRNFSKGKISGV